MAGSVSCSYISVGLTVSNCYAVSEASSSFLCKEPAVLCRVGLTHMQAMTRTLRSLYKLLPSQVESHESRCLSGSEAQPGGNRSEEK